MTVVSIGAGLTAIGVSIGVGMASLAALQAMARQPEIAPKLQVTMLIGAALIEGVGLFALVICFLGL